MKSVLEDLILAIHHRNGGQLKSVDFSRPLLDPVFCLDSLDLAEIMAEIEKLCLKSPFDAPETPRTWQDIADFLAQNQRS